MKRVFIEFLASFWRFGDFHHFARVAFAILPKGSIIIFYYFML